MLLVGFTGYQALKAKTALQRVAADFETLSGQLTSGDQPAARATLADAQRNAREALENTNGPGWWLSSKIPQVGPNVDAVRVVAQVSDRLASDVLPDVVTATGVLQPEKLRPVKGRIDLEPIRAVTPEVVRAASLLSTQSQRVQAIDVEQLAPQIARPVMELQSRIAGADALADRASRAVSLLPDMLGADGPRRYLFMFQNNAEIRATGGIPGAFATITATNGRIRLGEQNDAGTIGRFARPPVPLTAQEKTLFGDTIGIYPQDVNFTPDFPRSAELISGMWKARRDTAVDGVVSVDPVALSYLLRGTGPVSATGGQRITAQNAVRLLLSQVYADIPVPAQNLFYNAVARSVFDAVSSGIGNPRAVLDNVVRAASERRLLVWSARPDEQRLLRPTALGGALEVRATKTPEVGVYFNASRPSKLDYYLDYSASVRSTRCVGTRQHLSVQLTMRSRVPRKFGFLSDYVAPSLPGFGRGSILVTPYFFVPVDGRATAVSVDGQDEPFGMSALDGRRLIRRTVELEPGQVRSLVVDMVSGPGQTDAANLRVTPGVRSTGIGTVEPSAC